MIQADVEASNGMAPASDWDWKALEGFLVGSSGDTLPRCIFLHVSRGPATTTFRRRCRTSEN